MFMFYVPSSEPLPTFANTDPKNPAWAPERFHGGLASVQILRYRSSPVGPYDELLIVPGKFSHTTNDNGVLVNKKNLRVSRIYVSQKESCYNGRKNWNIPKELARFEFAESTPGRMSVKVFPTSTTSSSPFFSAIFQAVPYSPCVPLSMNWMKYFRLDISLVQPPLSRGNGRQGETPSTDKWCKILPLITSKKARVGWWDVKQDQRTRYDATEQDPLLSVNHVSAGETLAEGMYSTEENWWPGLGRYRLGVSLEDADVVFGEGEFWDEPTL